MKIQKTNPTADVSFQALVIVDVLDILLMEKFFPSNLRLAHYACCFSCEERIVMFNFRVWRLHDDEPACGFALGNMEFSTENDKISSVSHSRFFMMVYLSIVGLVDGLLLLKSNKKKKFEFIGIDSSFIVIFKIEKSKVSITSRNVCLGRFDLDHILGAIDLGIDRFLENNNNLAENDPAFCDLHRSINALKRILSGSQGKYPV
jgi:hypothetical protein